MLNEYQAAHGHGSGWSWDHAKATKGKATDMILAQAQDWDDEVAKLGTCDSAMAAFDPTVRAKWSRAWAWARGMCVVQLGYILETRNPDKYQQMAFAELPGDAGRVQKVVQMSIAATLSGSGRVLRTIGAGEYQELVREVCGALGGRMADIRVSDQSGAATWERWLMTDGSEIRVTVEGVR
jgi:hypothetical protein